MPYVFYDLPADSADLETFNGYHVGRVFPQPRGGPVLRKDTELVLTYHRQPWFAPATVCAGRTFKGYPRRRLRGFMSPAQAASLLSVPSLCFIAIWLLGHVWP